MNIFSKKDPKKEVDTLPDTPEKELDELIELEELDSLDDIDDELDELDSLDEYDDLDEYLNWLFNPHPKAYRRNEILDGLVVALCLANYVVHGVFLFYDLLEFTSYGGIINIIFMILAYPLPMFISDIPYFQRYNQSWIPQLSVLGRWLIIAVNIPGIIHILCIIFR